MDCNGFSISCQYGKHHKGYDVSFDKRVDFMRTACELMGKDKFVGYRRGQHAAPALHAGQTRLHFLKDGQWHFLFDKNTWRVNERIFQSATVDGEKVYLKVVNASGEPQKLRADLVNFGKKKKAHVITLSDEDRERHQHHRHDIRLRAQHCARMSQGSGRSMTTCSKIRWTKTALPPS